MPLEDTATSSALGEMEWAEQTALSSAAQLEHKVSTLDAVTGRAWIPTSSGGTVRAVFLLGTSPTAPFPAPSVVSAISTGSPSQSPLRASAFWAVNQAQSLQNSLKQHLRLCRETATEYEGRAL